MVDNVEKPKSEPNRGIVFSGGGARGAYEAGVLSYIFEELPEALLQPGRVRVLSGTSVGAIHACYLAATAHIPRHNIQRVVDLWRKLNIEQMLRLRWKDLVSLPFELSQLFRQKDMTRGVLLDSRSLQKVVVREVPWPYIRHNLRAGILDALTVSATHIASGRTTVFIDRPRGGIPPWTRDVRRVAADVRIGPQHALASAAIPILFPAMAIDNAYYCDGGLRQNTPLSPALRLGVDRALVIGLSQNYEAKSAVLQARAHKARQLGQVYKENYPGPFILFGKVLDALLLDHLDYDLQRLEGINRLLQDGATAYGESFLTQLNHSATYMRGANYRHIDTVVIRPSQDLGELAVRFVSANQKRLRGVLGWFLNKLSEEELFGSSDLLSYLMFDGQLAQQLIALGRADADASRERYLSTFVFDYFG